MRALAYKSRRLELRAHQIPVEEQALAYLEAGDQAVILAACPGFGKTETSISFIGSVLARNPDWRVLVLTHGTSVLRTNFSERMEKYDLPFTYATYLPKGVDGHRPFSELTEQVVVGLPQSIGRVHDLGVFDLVVVDEAHEFYLAPTVQRIIKQAAPTWQLLLTGTPGSLVKLGFPIIPVTLKDNFEAGLTANPLIELATSSYDLTLDDYDQKNELSRNHSWSAAQTKSSLDSLLTALSKRLQYQRTMKEGWTRLHEVGYKIAQATPDWKWVLRRLKKTMVACRSIRQANQVGDYFMRLGVKALVSHSENDIDSEALESFRKDKTIQLLVVVQRGTLGYDFSDLAHVIDMTGSLNAERIYQLMTRVIRKSGVNRNKLFVKLAPNGPGMQDYTFAIMSLVMRLAMDADFLSTWDGRISSNPNVVVRKSTPKTKFANNQGKAVSKAPKAPPPIDESLLMLGPQGWQDLIYRANEPYSAYKWTTVKDYVNVNQGWVSLPMNKAQQWASTQGCKTRKEWYSRTSIPGFLLKGVPINPYVVYGKEFTKRGGWGWWLGTGATRNGTWLPMEEAALLAASKGTRSKNEWVRRVQEVGFLPDGVPANPPQVYGQKEFTSFGGWGRWVGSGTIAPQNKKFLPFDEAQKWASSQGITGVSEWKRRGKDPGFLPPGIPADPYCAYGRVKFTEAGGWGLWLGTGNCRGGRKK